MPEHVFRLQSDNGVVRNVRSADILLEFGKHHVIIVDVVYRARFLQTLPSGLLKELEPVTVDIGRAPSDVIRIYGYVHHWEALPWDTEHAVEQVIRYVLIGTSLPMNNQRTKIWERTTRSAVVREVANRYGLRSVIHPHRVVENAIVQDGESDFQFLNRLAEDVGYRFWVDGSTLWFISPRLTFEGPRTGVVPVLTVNKNQVNHDDVRDLSIIEGRMVHGLGRPTRTTVFGVDTNSGFTFGSVGGDGPTIEVLSVPVRSVQEADRQLDANQQRNERWSQATGEVRGNVLLRPGGLIYLQGSAVPSESVGRWLVTKVRHIHSSQGTMRTHFTAERPAESLTETPPTNLSRIIETVPCRLVDGIWQSTMIGDFYAPG